MRMSGFLVYPCGSNRMWRTCGRSLRAGRRIAGSSRRGAEDVHQAADRAAFFGHRDEQLAGAAVGVEADGDVAFVAGDVNLWVMLWRVSARRSRRGFCTAAAAARSPSVLVESGWLPFEPSR